MIQWIKKQVVENRWELRFITLFALLFFAAQTLYLLSGHVSFPTRLQTFNTHVSAAVINVIRPSENASAIGKTLKSVSGHSIEIAWGCEGVEGIFIVAAALLAFRMSKKRKITGILAGTFILFAINIMRIITLFFVAKYKLGLFELMHVYIGQTVTIFSGIVFFVLWTMSDHKQGQTE